ncbi:MAG: DUF285 domain-containing protein, partial [Bernardetiaceae bacterium]|nr:DUF285 domain-containing protein [Bernardetiaceae bacterium]
VSSVTNMNNMFFNASDFNNGGQPLTWTAGTGTAAVTDMSIMFGGATSFNQDISTWNTASVTTMGAMFSGATSFNQPIGAWNTTSVTNMTQMFLSATSFNQDISTWNTAGVTNMAFMLRFASAFNQNIGSWNLSSINSVAGQSLFSMLDNCGMDVANYDATLIGWAANPSTPNNLDLGANGLEYCAAQTERETDLAITKNWTITGDNFACPIYYSIADGNWTENTTWSATSGGLPVSPAAMPMPAGATVVIEDGFTVTSIAAADLAANLDISITDGTLTLENGNNVGSIATLTTTSDAVINLIAGDFNLADPAATTIKGTINRQTIGAFPNGLTFDDGSTYIHARNGGTIPTATWEATSTVQVTGATNVCPDGFEQTFGNFVWNSSISVSCDLVDSGVMTVQGDFTKMGSGDLSLVNGVGTSTLNINGNYSGNVFNIAAFNGIGTMNVAGNITGAILRITSTNGGEGTVTVGGNVSLTNRLNAQNGTNTFILNGTAPQNVSIAALDANVPLEIRSTSTNTVTLINSPNDLGAGTKFLNITSGTFDMGTQALTLGYVQGTGNLTLGNGAILTLNGSNATLFTGTLTADANSLVNYNSTAAQNIFAPSSGSYGNLTLTNANTKTLLGNIRLIGNFTNNAGVANFNPNAFAVSFIGTTPQTLTGETHFHGLTINNTNPTVADRTITLNNPITVNNALTLTAGRVVIGNNDFTYLGTNANITPVNGGWIQTNDTGEFIRNSSTAGNNAFPVGDATAQRRFILFSTFATPVSVRFTPTIAPAIFGTNPAAGMWVVNVPFNAAVGLQNAGVATNSPSLRIYKSDAGSPWQVQPTNSTFPAFSTNFIPISLGTDQRITVFQAPNTYYSLGNATWNVSSNLWSIDGINPCDCSPAGAPDATVYIRNNHVVTVTNAADIGLDNIVELQDDGVLTLQNGNTNAIATLTTSAGSTINLLAGDFNLAAPAATTINGTINRETTGTFPNGLTFADGATYIHARDGGVIPTAIWEANSTVSITGITNTALTGGFDQIFGNFTWDCPSQNLNQNTGAGGVMTVAGNFTVISTGSSNFIFARDLNVGGNFDNQVGTPILDLDAVTTTFNGGAIQTISGGSGVRFRNLIIDQSPASIIDVTSSNLIVINALALNNGRIRLNNTNLTYAPSDDTNLTRINGWVETNGIGIGGFFSRVAGTNLLFPVGSDNDYQPVQIANTGTGAIVRFGAPNFSLGGTGVGSWYIRTFGTTSAVTFLDPQGTLINGAKVHRNDAFVWTQIPTSFAAPDYTTTTAATTSTAVDEFAIFSKPFITTWQTTDNQIIIPTTGGGYNYDIYWENLDNPGVGDGSHTGATGNYTITGLANGDTYEVHISGDFPHFYMNNNATERTKLYTIEQWGDIAWTSMENAFWGCTNLEVNATDAPDLSGVTNMNSMFRGASSFDQDISSWNVSSVTNMGSMFQGASAFNNGSQPLTWTVGTGTAAVTSMGSMFRDASSFDQDISSWNVSSVTNMNNMFFNASDFNNGGQPLTWTAGTGTAAVTDMSIMFGGAT